MAEKKQQTQRSKKKRFAFKPTAPRFLRPVTGYFAGAWQELAQVRWPDRTATWSLTLAVMAFSALFAAIILGLDTLFQYVFKEIIL